MNQRLVLIVVASVTVILILGVVLVPFGMQVPRDINDYGTVTVHSLYGGDEGRLGDVLSEGDTIVAEDMLLVVWHPDPNYSGEPTCELYSAAGVWYETGGWTFTTYQDVYRHQWVFELATVPLGTTEFYCAFGGMYTEEISWTGSTIHFNIVSSTAPADTVVEFTEEPVDTSGASGELITLRWWLVCEGAATGVVTVDEVAESPRTITPSDDPQSFTYTFSESIAGNYTVTLTITPEYGDEISSSCEVIVTSTVTTTTTTTDTTTTTTETGTTTEPNGVEPDYLWFYAIIAVVVIAIVLKAAK